MRSSARRRTPWTGAASRVPARAALAAVAAAAALAGCDVEWGGASVRLEDPAPRDTAADSAAAGGGRAEPVPELPRGPLLYVVGLDSAGRARAAPAARLVGGRLHAIDWPSDPPDVYLERFGRAFQPPGAEVPLLAGGGRVGSLLLSDRRFPVEGACPPTAGGRALLPPGRRAPEYAFAVSPRDSAVPLGAAPPAGSTRRMRVFAPILAERLLQEAGVEQEFLARRVDLRPVRFPDADAPGMAATFLIRDSLSTAPPPSGASTSLFFLARYEPAEGFVPVWSRVRQYDSGAGKDVLTHLGWIRTEARPLHLVQRITAGGRRLAAFRLGEGAPDGELGWVESGGCPALEALIRSTPRAAGSDADTVPRP